MTQNSLEYNPAVQKTLEIVRDQSSRFLLAGSYGRAAILGEDLMQISHMYGRSKRYQDVDVIDLQGILRRKYSVTQGATLDSQLTKHVRPTNERAWGLHDQHDPIGDPLVSISIDTFPTQDLEIEGIGQVRTLTPAGHLALSHVIDYFRPYPKHPDHIKRLLAETSYVGSELEAAMTEHTARMKERYPRRSMYGVLSSRFFAIAPSMGMLLSDGVVGSAIRTIRGTDYDALDLGTEPLDIALEPLTIKDPIN